MLARAPVFKTSSLALLCELVVVIVVFGTPAAHADDETSPTVTIVVPIDKDTTISKQDPNRNEGGSPVLYLREGFKDRIMLGVNRRRVRLSLEGLQLLSATLEMTVVHNEKDFSQNGSKLLTNRMRRYWSEGNGWYQFAHEGSASKGNGIGATWNCPFDFVIQNDNPDCFFYGWWPGGLWGWTIAWKPSPWSAVVAAKANASNDLDPGDVVTFDVTADVQAFYVDASNWQHHYGWVVRRQVEPGQGTILFASHSHPKYQPRLVLEALKPTKGNTIPEVTLNTSYSVWGGKLTFSGLFTDPDDDTWNASVDFGDGTGAHPITLGADQTFQKQYKYAVPGTYSITVTVWDDQGGLDTQTMGVKIPVPPPGVDVGEPEAAEEGKLWSHTALVTTTGQWNAKITVDYGDGSGKETVTGNSDGQVPLSHAWLEDGVYTVALTAVGDGGTTKASFDVTVLNLPPIVSLTAASPVPAGQALQAQVHVTDPGADMPVVTLSWGDGTAAVVSDPVPNGTPLELEHTYSHAGSYLVVATADDGDGGYDVDELTVEVLPVPELDAGPDGTLLEGGTFVSQAAVVDALEVVVDYGDGGEPSTLSATSGLVPLERHYADDGVFTVTVTAYSAVGTSVTDTALVIVDNVAPTLAVGGDETLVRGAPLERYAEVSDPGADTVQVGVDWGDGVVKAPGTGLKLVHTYASAGVYAVVVTAADEDGGQTAAGFTVTILTPAPTIGALADSVLDEGAPLTGHVPVTDATTALIDYGDGGEPSLVPVDADGLVALEHTYADDGAYPLTIFVEGAGGDAAAASVVTVNNVPPSLAVGGDETLTIGSLFSRAGTVTDPGADELTVAVDAGFGATDVPVVDGAFGLAWVADTVGVWTVVVLAEDDDGGATTASFVVSVVHPPEVLDAGGDAIVDEGSPWLSLATVAHATSVTVDYGDGTPAVTADVGPSGTVPLEHTWTDDGVFALQLTASGPGGDASAGASITVKNVAPTLSMDTGPVQLAVGESIVRSGSVSDPGADALSVVADFGGGPVPVALVDGAFELTHEVQKPGVTTVLVTATDDDGGVAALSFDVIALPLVAEAGEDHTLPEGSTLTGAAQAKNATSATVDYGDGSPVETVEVPETGELELSHTYLDDGVYTLTVTAFGPVDPASDAATVTVTNVAPSIDVADAAQIVAGEALDLTGAVTDPGADELALTLSIDGAEAAPYPLDGGVFNVTGSWPAAGEHTLTFVVTDDDGGEASAALTVTVEPFLDAGPDVSVSEGTAFASAGEVTEGVVVMIDYGDGSPTELVDAGEGGSLPLAHTYVDDGTYTVLVSAGDSTDTATLTVTNVAPTVTLEAEALQTVDGQALALTGSFTDPGADSWTASVDWGDGTSGPLTLADDGTFAGSHAYPEAGIWSVTVTVRDDDGGEGTAAAAATVLGVGPTVQAGGGGEIAEGTTLLRAGKVLVADQPPPVTATVDYGDGSPVEPLALGPGGTFELHHLYMDDGALTITITALNGEGTPGVGTIPLTVNNIAPIVDLGGNVVVDVDETLALSGSVVDPGDDTLTATVDYGDGATKPLPIGPAGSLSLSHSWSKPGYYPITVEVADDDGGVGKHTVLAGVGLAPLLVDAGEDETLYEGSEWARLGTFTDTEMPIQSAVVDFGDGTGEQTMDTTPELGFSLVHTFADEGEYDVVVTIADLFGNVGVDVVVVTVENVVPVVAAGPDALQEIGDTFASVGSFTDPGTDTWAGTVDYGAGGGEESLALAPDKTFALEHAYTKSGTYTVKVSVDDGDDGAHTDSVVVEVPNVVPEVSLEAAEVVAVEGAAFTLAGSFTDLGTDKWSGSADYGDGLDPVTLKLQPDKSFLIDHVYLDDGVYTLTVTVEDGLGALGSAVATITVANAAPAVAVAPLEEPALIVEGGSFAGVATVTDASEADTHTAEADWGDGSGPQPAAVKGDRTAKLNHEYADDGTYTVTVTVTDDDGGVGVGTTTVTVENAPPVVDVGPHATVGSGVPLSRTGSFSDPGADTFTAVVDYGEGAGPETLTLGLDRTFTLSHTYASDGIYTIKVAVTDDDGGVGSSHFNANVGTVIPVLTLAEPTQIDEGGTFAMLGAFDDVASDSWTATVDYGDGEGPQSLDLGLDKTFTLLHTYVDDGAYTVVVAITDDDGGVGTAERIVPVANVAPIVDLGADVLVDEGKAFKGVYTVVDPGADEWSAEVDYGDGSEPAALNVSEEGELKLAHAYADDGAFPVVVTVFDDDGGSSISTITAFAKNVMPSVVVPPGTEIDEGGTWLPDSSGSFSDPGADEWAVTVNYGDGTGVHALEVAEDKTFVVGRTYPDDGEMIVTVTVTDDDGGLGSATTTVLVANVAPVVDLGDDLDADGTGAFARAGSFEDPGADEWLATVDYGDGSGVQPLAPTLDKTFVLSHAYTSTGTFDVTVVVADDDGGVGGAVLHVTVDDLAPGVSVPSPIEGVEGVATLISGTFTDSGVGPWTAAIDFGDGESAPLTLGEDKTFAAEHVYADDGSYPVVVHVSDGLGFSGEGTATAVVLNAPPVISLGGAAVFDDGTLEREGAFEDLGDDTWTATVDFGDGSGQQPLSLAGKTFHLSYTYPTPGSYAVTVRISDEDGGVGVAVIDAHNCAPPEGYTKLWMGGDSASPADWENGANWNPVGVPVPTDSVFVCGSVATPPALTVNTQVVDVLVAGGASLELGELLLTATGSVQADGPITGSGQLLMTGEDATVSGTLPGLVVKGDIRLSGVCQADSVTIHGMKSLSLNGHHLEVLGELVLKNNNTQGAVHLVMAQETDRLLVGGDAIFAAPTSLTGGVIELKGAFVQTFASTAFRPQGTLVELSGESVQEVSFKHPTSSWFEDVLVANPAGVRYVSDAFVQGGLTLAPGAVLRQDSFRLYFVTKLPEVAAGTYDVDTTVVVGDVTMTADLVLNEPSNDVMITSGSSLTLNGHKLRVGGDLDVANSVAGDPHLLMVMPSDELIVDGNMDVGGRTRLDAGAIRLRGDLRQLFNNEALRPKGTRVVFDGGAQQSVFFAHPALDQSYLRDVTLANPVGVRLDSPLQLSAGELLVASDVDARLTSNGQTVTAAGGTVNVDGLVVDDTRLVLTGVGVTSLADVNFTGFDAAATPLTVNHTALTATVSGLVFETEPVSGTYITANDTDGSTSPCQLTVTGSSPAYGLPRTHVTGGFEIVWGTGAEDSDGDGVPDAVELGQGTDPLDPTSAPFLFDSALALDSGDPVDLVARDLDADGLTDIASTDAAANAVSFYFGKSLPVPTLEAGEPLPLPGTPGAIASGDIDGNARPDLVVASASEAAVYVAYQASMDPGTFGAPEVVGLPSQASDVAVADVDGDGLADIVVSLPASDAVALLLQDGAGGFAAPIQLPMGNAPGGLLVVDITGDGRLDIATADTAAGTVTLRPQHPTQDGVYVGPSSWIAGPGAAALAAGDIDGDGLPDLVVAARGGDSVALLLQVLDSPGTFRPALTLSSGSEPVDVVLCDLDQDGALDVVTADAASETGASVLLNDNGASQASLYPAIPVDGGAPARAVACAPLSTGAPALITVNASAGEVSVLVP